MGFDQETATKAFGLVIAAGAATAIGAGVVFFPSLASLANRKSLAVALGLSAGVMLYVSMVDIYSKAIGGFEEQGHTGDDAFIYASLCFFGGIVIMKLISIFTKVALGHNDDHDFDPEAYTNKTPPSAGVEQHQDDEEVDTDALYDDETSKPAKPVVQKVPVTESKDKDKDSGLMNMGVATAIAIALHNFPEGLVTFVAYTEDPTLGIVLAIGIGLHNIPEGLCISMPIYYATGNRWQAFLWGILSGLSEPLGALIGWLVLGSSFSGNTYGILFGVVAGIMVFIAIDELLPTAHRYDPHGHVVTYSVFAGMLALAGSLMLFSL